MRRASIALALFLAACATTAPPEPSTRVTVEVFSWGYLQERWSVSATGEASLERVPQGAQLATPPVSQTFTITPEEFEQVRAALAPAEPLVGNITCNRTITDMPYGAVKWQRGDGSEDTISFDYGCQPNPGLELLFERLEAAGNAFTAATAQ